MSDDEQTEKQPTESATDPARTVEGTVRREDIFLLVEDNRRPVDRSPGTWKKLLLADGGISATVTCPKCGAYGTLEKHRIHKNGGIWPSLVCPNECGFHEANVFLDGWQGP